MYPVEDVLITAGIVAGAIILLGPGSVFEFGFAAWVATNSPEIISFGIPTIEFVLARNGYTSGKPPEPGLDNGQLNPVKVAYWLWPRLNDLYDALNDSLTDPDNQQML